MIPNLYVENGWKSPNIHENKSLFGVPGYDILYDFISTLVDPDFIRLRLSFAKFEGFPSRKPKKTPGKQVTMMPTSEDRLMGS